MLAAVVGSETDVTLQWRFLLRGESGELVGHQLGLQRLWLASV